MNFHSFLGRKLMTKENISKKNPTKEDWEGLYQAAIRFKENSPWVWMENGDLFAVENPFDGETGYCSVLGNGGQEFGLVLFLGAEGYNAYMRLMMDESETVRPEPILDTCALSVLFVNRDELARPDMAVIRSLGLNFRGNNAWPLFRSQRPGYLPWYLEKEEALFLTSALQQAVNVVIRVRDNDLDLFAGSDADLVLTRYFYEGQWLDEWRKPRVAEEQVRVSVTLDKERLRRLHDATGKKSGSWELDLFILPAAIDSGTGRPYYPNCILAVERNQGLIVGTDLLGPGLSLKEKQEAFIRLLEKATPLPQEIRVGNKEVGQLVEPVAEELGISISIAPLRLLGHARRSLFEHVSRKSL